MTAAVVWRWRWAIGVAALLAAGLVLAFWPEATPVDAGTVSAGPMIVGVTDDGVTRAEDTYVVSAPVTGYLARIELEPGDRVVAGTPITRMTGAPSTPLDPRGERELRAALAALRAGEAGVQADLDQAGRDLARAEALAARGFLPRAQLEQRRTRVAGLRAALAQARGESRRVETLLSAPGGSAGTAPVIVRAPAAGAVLSVLTESEGVIAQGTPLLTIGDPRRIEAVVDLISRQAARVRPGQRVLITQWGGDQPISGRVLRVEPFGFLKVSALGIEEQRVNVIVGFDPSDAGKLAALGHGYQIDATIVLWSADRVVRLPIGALFRGAGGDWRTFLIRNGRAAERAVRLGQVNDEWAEVLEGLRAGDRVVLNPGAAVADGTRVRPRD